MANIENHGTATARVAFPGTSLASGDRVFNPWLSLVALSCGLFMTMLDSTVVNIAISTIQKDLHTSLTLVSWVLNAFNIAFAALLVTTGHFADQFGRKKLFMLGLVLFSLGSLCSALSPSIEWVIASRIVQAAGAAALNSIGLAIITALFPYAKRAIAIGIWGALGGLASAIGPILGGILVSKLGWRSIFVANIPFCLLGLILVLRLVPESRDPHASTKVDFAGLLTFTLAIFCLILAIIEGKAWGWLSLNTLSLFVVALVSLISLFFIESRHSHPIIDISLFKVRSFLAPNLAMFLFGTAVQGVVLILVLYMLNARSFSPIVVAFALLPLSLTTFAVSGLSGPLGKRLTPQIEGTVGLSLLTAGLLLLATMPAEASIFDICWREAIVGAGMGLSLVCFPKAALAEVARAKLGVGSGVFNTFRQVGYAMGVAILVSVLNSYLPASTKALTQAFVAYQITWFIAALIAAVGVISALFISARPSQDK